MGAGSAKLGEEKVRYFCMSDVRTNDNDVVASKAYEKGNSDYIALNSLLNFYDDDGKIQFDKDKEAVRQYFLNHVNSNMQWFHSLEEKLDFLIENEYYEKEFLDQYSREFVKDLFKQAYAVKFRFPTFVGAYKFYNQYAMKTFDGKRYLERYEDRISVVALYLARGDEALATKLMLDMVEGRYQPATPTFLNSGKKQRGDLVSCFLIDIQDNMESISRAHNAALQLSKRGGGVALQLSNLRNEGAPIKKIENQSSGVVPVMKMLEDAFSYANQLGQRQGSGAVYLHAHHPDIMKFLDTRRENADEKIRIKTLSLGIVVPDVTFKLAAEGKDMYLFSPYDVERVYGKPFTQVSINEEYDRLVANPEISKKKLNARKFFQTVAEVQFESGYPYILFEDNANRANPIDGRITMSNLCSEILQTNTPSIYNDDLSYSHIGKDISCNLGSLNIAKVMETGSFAETIENSMRSLSAVSDLTDLETVPSIRRGNNEMHSVGLGAMNLHGYLAKERIHYGSKEGLDFTNMFFYCVNFYSLQASSKIAEEKGERFAGFEKSDYANGVYFEKYTAKEWAPKTEKVAGLFEKYGIHIPTQEDWRNLQAQVEEHGVYSAWRMAVAPTGSISYVSSSTQSILPQSGGIVEARKEGKMGRVYYPAPYATNDNIEYYSNAYELGYKKIIDTYAVATQHIDQGASCTLHLNADEASTRTLNQAQIYAWKRGLKTLYYVRVSTGSLEGTDMEGCVSCSI